MKQSHIIQFVLLAVLLNFIPNILSQIVNIPEAVKEVNLQKLTELSAADIDGIKMKSGYVQFSNQGEIQQFNFIVAEQIEQKEKPLGIVISGGDNYFTSVLIPLFYEVGPFIFQSNDEGVDTLQKNLHSWTQQFNLIFIESFSGLGFSKGNMKSAEENDDQQRIKNTYKIINAILDKDTEIFTNKVQQKIYLLGSGYSGILLPQLATSLVYHKIKAYTFEKIIMGNPIFKNYCEKPDATKRKLTDYDLNMIVYLQKNFLVSDETSKALENCKANVNSATCGWGLSQKTSQVHTLNIFGYDQKCDSTDQEIHKIYPCQKLGKLKEFLTTPTKMAELNPYTVPLTITWKRIVNDALIYKQDCDQYGTALQYIKQLVIFEKKIVIYSGDMVIKRNYIDTLYFIQQILNFELTAPQTPLMMNVYGWGEQIIGWSTDYSIIKFIKLRGGHFFAPHYNSLQMNELLKKLVE